MAPVEGDLVKKTRRKLVKKRMPQRHTSMHFPERFQFGDDAQDDVTATAGKPTQYMNQSIFSMIAAAGSKTNFHARFEDESSDSEGNDDTNKAVTQNVAVPPEFLGQRPQEIVMRQATNDEKQIDRRHPMTNLPKLDLRTSKEPQHMSQSSSLPVGPNQSSLESLQQVTPRDAPIMSQMLAAQADLSPMIEGVGEQHVLNPPDVLANSKGPVTLATRLMQIFGLEVPEEVMSG